MKFLNIIFALLFISGCYTEYNSFSDNDLNETPAQNKLIGDGSWASYPEYTSGPYAGEPNKIMPSHEELTQGFFPDEAIRPEVVNYVFNNFAEHIKNNSNKINFLKQYKTYPEARFTINQSTDVNQPFTLSNLTNSHKLVFPGIEKIRDAYVLLDGNTISLPGPGYYSIKIYGQYTFNANDYNTSVGMHVVELSKPGIILSSFVKVTTTNSSSEPIDLSGELNFETDVLQPFVKIRQSASVAGATLAAYDAELSTCYGIIRRVRLPDDDIAIAFVDYQ